MVELVRLVSEHGILIILAGLYIYNSAVTDKRTEEMLREIQFGNTNIAKSNENIAKTLDIIREAQRENLSMIKQIQSCMTNERA